MASLSSSMPCFPLRMVGDVRRLFEVELSQKEPDLVRLSIVVGHLEHLWTKHKNVVSLANRASSSDEDEDDGTPGHLVPVEPAVEWSMIETLRTKFESMVVGCCDSGLLEAARRGAAEVEPTRAGLDSMRSLIKHVADIVWNTLSKGHYNDRLHLQSIYSYLTERKLDCFGVSLAVVAACQMLQVSHVHLALSEDHSWVVFGRDGTETAEVTWIGKGTEDKRGLPVDIAKAKSSWLYSAGQPVVCNRHMEVSALVSNINTFIKKEIYSVECDALQQELLWLLYDMGHLQQYPLGLSKLAHQEEYCPSFGRPNCAQIFTEAIDVSRSVYANQHIYPYTFKADYHRRLNHIKEAFKEWAEAAEAIRRYNYSKDDGEIYNEFKNIAITRIPQILEKAKECPLLLRDPELYAFVLRFYDGMCCWEEGSSTAVLHSTWATAMVGTCSKFDFEIRSKVDILQDDEGDGEPDDDDDDDEAQDSPASSKKVLLQLHSVKMRGLKGLLCAEKLNTSAIQLQLTAQSQTSSASDNVSRSGRAKRARRE